MTVIMYENWRESLNCAQKCNTTIVMYASWRENCAQECNMTVIMYENLREREPELYTKM